MREYINARCKQETPIFSEGLMYYLKRNPVLKDTWMVFIDPDYNNWFCNVSMAQAREIFQI